MRAPLTSVLGLATALAITAAARAQDVPLDAAALFDDRQLQEIRLVVNPRDWADLKASFQLNTYYAAHLIWRGQVAKNVGIRSRGTGSRSGEKPGLRVDFNRFDDTQQFLGLKSIILRNHVQDPSQLHERVAMRVFAEIGLPAPREAHVRLYVNDDYAGVYSVVEAVDKVFLADRFGQDGGYLYEYDSNPGDPPYRFEDRGPAPSAYSPTPFRPVTHELEPDARPIANLVSAIAQTPDADFHRVVSAFLDLEAFVRHVAVEAFLAHEQLLSVSIRGLDSGHGDPMGPERVVQGRRDGRHLAQRGRCAPLRPQRPDGARHARADAARDLPRYVVALRGDGGHGMARERSPARRRSDSRRRPTGCGSALRVRRVRGGRAAAARLRAAPERGRTR
jgi:hypothetical protein